MGNLEIIEKSRIRPRPGDLFAMKVKRRGYLFGRVIRIDAVLGGFPNCKLLYIYRQLSQSIDTIPELRKEGLLIPPIGTNNLGWRHGFFKTIRRDGLRDEDVLARHCFEGAAPGRYYDEFDHRLSQMVEPCGVRGVASYLVIDDLVSTALGLPVSES